MTIKTGELKVKCTYCGAEAVIPERESRRGFMTLFGRFTRAHKQCDANEKAEAYISNLKADAKNTTDMAIKKAMSI